MIHQLFRFALSVLFVGAFLASCASSPKEVDPASTSTSLVFGYMDMAKAPTQADWVSFRSYAGSVAGESYSMGVKNGLFFHIAVEPGSYQIDTFGGVKTFTLGSSPSKFTYNFGTAGRNESATQITKPGLYYVGAWRYVPHDGGIFKDDKFSVQAITTPSEKELLGRLIASLEGDKGYHPYARQLALAKQRYAQLR